MFKPSKLRTYLMLAEDAGLCPTEILEGSGVSWDEIASLKPLDLDTIVGLFDYLAERTPAGFAITSAYASKVRNYGIVGFATMSMPTLRDALQHWSRYCLVAGDPLITRIMEKGDQWQMSIEPRLYMPEPARRYCLEAAVAAIEPVIEELTGAPAKTLRIDFPFGRPGPVDVYGLFQTTNVYFDRNTTVYYGDRSDLDRLIPAGDSAISAFFHRQCDQFLSDLMHGRSLAERLEDLMRESGGDVPTLDEMAVALATSRRSLQRELRKEGLNYQQIVRQFRMRHAMMLLRENRTHIKTIAFMLGFQDVGSFRRAFQEWTGQALGEWIAGSGRGDLAADTVAALHI
ncbi:MAG TPA: AraC family transcriptional regulator ligand-binding domain-containing protein [Sphingobium sp.]|uniref:helix-turn-helix transcriptional regulator n=1 Tax=Sphingobium sp. TaxID=1912891 RepID=UPI002ED4C33D